MVEIISKLWDAGVFGAILTGAVTFFGQLIALGLQHFKDTVDVLKGAQTADITAHDAAFKRSAADGGTWMRRLMFAAAFLMLGLCPIIFAMFFKDVPIAVESSREVGGWLWGLIPSREEVYILYVHGFYLSEVWKDMMLNLISAYVGGGLVRGAFKLGR